MKKVLSLLFIIPLFAVILTACGNDDNKKQDGKVTINTTVYPLQFAEQIGGKHVDVKSIYPAGTDLHSYEPTQKDILNASKADLFVYTGDDLDPVAKKVASTIKDKNKTFSSR